MGERLLAAKKRRDVNKHFLSKMKNSVVNTRKLIAQNLYDEAAATIPTLESQIMSICGKGIIHKNKARRLISRIASRTSSYLKRK